MQLPPILGFYKDLFWTSRRWIWLILGVFLAASVVGFVVFSSHPDLVETIFGYFKNLLGENPPENGNLVILIFKQNITTSLFALVGGVVLGLLSLAIVLVNGFILGFVIHFLFRVLPTDLGTKFFIIVITLLPHGIFELPIILISAALGMQWGIAWLLPKSKGKRLLVWKQNAKSVFLFIPLLVLVLLLAAVIEVFVSSKLAGLYAGKLL
jgi:stage II sporulation protein M